MRGGSKRLGAIGLVIAKRLIGDWVELSVGCAALELPIPRLPIELGEPRSELCDELLMTEGLGATWSKHGPTRRAVASCAEVGRT